MEKFPPFIREILFGGDFDVGVVVSVANANAFRGNYDENVPLRNAARLYTHKGISGAWLFAGFTRIRPKG